MTTFQNFIGGAWVAPASGAYFDNINPADTSDRIGRFPRSGAEDVAQAVASAQRGFARWRRTPAPARGGRRAAPPGEAALGGRHGLRHVLRPGAREAPDAVARVGRVDVVEVGAGGGRDPRAADEVLEGRHEGGIYRSRARPWRSILV